MKLAEAAATAPTDPSTVATRTLALERSAKGAWTVDGAATRELRGCTDVDLGCSPSTNTLPIRRLRLGIGASQTIQAAWIRFPEAAFTKPRTRAKW